MKSFLGVESAGSRNTDFSVRGREKGAVLWNNKDICRFFASKRGVSQSMYYRVFPSHKSHRV